MPQLNSNEKRLLLTFGIIAFVAANVFGYLLVSAFMKGLAAEEVKLTERLKGLEEAKALSGEADEKRLWMDANLKAYASEEDRETHLDDVITGRLTSGLEVELSKSSTMPTITGEYFVKSRFRTTVKGTWPDVKEYLWRLQKPEEFRFVPRLTMIPRKNELDDSKQLVEVSLEIEKWWPKPDSYIEGEIEEERIPAAIEQPPGDAVQPPAADTATMPVVPPAAPEVTAPAAMETPAEPSPAVVTPPPAPSTPAPPTDSN